MTSECYLKRIICKKLDWDILDIGKQRRPRSETQNAASDQGVHCLLKLQGPVVQSVVSLTSSLRVISLTILVDSIYHILIFFAEKCE